MKIYPVKLRNRAIPDKPITVSVNFAYSKVRGEFALNQICKIGEEGEKKADKIIDGFIKNEMGVLSEEEAKALDDEFMSDLSDD